MNFQEKPLLNFHLQRIESQIQILSKPAAHALEKITSRKEFKKGEFLLRQGQVCRQSYFILNGLARKYYLNDGKEITTELYFNNDIAVSFASYTLQQPSEEMIEALDTTVVSVTEYESFQHVKQQFPELLQLDLLLTEFYACWLEQRLFDFHTLQAAQRYEKLLREHPQAIQKIQLTHIASYLGVSLETLSRIRAKK